MRSRAVGLHVRAAPRHARDATSRVMLDAHIHHLQRVSSYPRCVMSIASARRAGDAHVFEATA
jgi:hypothetical protein